MTRRLLPWAAVALAVLAGCSDRATQIRQRQLSSQARDLASGDAATRDSATIVGDADLPIATTKPTVASFTITDNGFVGPDTLVGGAIELHVTNRGKRVHEFRLLQLPTGATQAFLTALAANSTRLPPTRQRGGIGPLPPGGSSVFILTEGPGEYIIEDRMPVGDGKQGWQVGLLRPLRLIGDAPAELQPPIMRVSSAVLASDALWRFGFSVTTSGRRSLMVEGRNRPTDIAAGRQLVMFEYLGGIPNHDAVILKADDPFVMRDYSAWLDGRRKDPPAGIVTGIPGLYGRMRLYMWLTLEHGGYIIFCPNYHKTSTKDGRGFEFGEFSQFIVR